MSALMVFSLAFAVSLLGVLLIVFNPAVRHVSAIEPTIDRWHTKVTPGLGGVAMFVAFSCALWIVSSELDASVVSIFAGASLLFFVGFLDDVRQCSPAIKLFAQCLAASLVVLIGQWPQLGSLFGAEHHWLTLIVNMVWMVAIANGINLLDNMDGLAAGVALTATVSLVVLLQDASGTHDSLRITLIGLSGALAGFLLLNINPARIFMGDSGSLWIGLVLGASSVTLTTSDSVSSVAFPWVLLIPVLVLAVPVLDTSFVIVTRKLRGQPVSQGGRDHLSHRLVRLGCSERVSVAILWLLSVIGAVVAYAVMHAEAHVWLSLLVVYAVSLLTIVALVSRVTITQDSVKGSQR